MKILLIIILNCLKTDLNLVLYTLQRSENSQVHYSTTFTECLQCTDSPNKGKCKI